MNTWKINKNDISYRFLNRWCDWIPRDFCGYYRKVMLVSLGLLLAGFLIGNMLLIPVYYVLGVTVPEHITSIAEFMLLICFMEWGGALCIGCIALFYYLKEKVEQWNDRNKCLYDADGNYIGRKVKQSIIKTWYKAKKEKFCPIIEFEDDKTEDLTPVD